MTKKGRRAYQGWMPAEGKCKQSGGKWKVSREGIAEYIVGVEETAG